MKKNILFLFLFSISSILTAQVKIVDGVTINGSLQTEMLFPEEDEAINAKKDNWLQSNNYLNLNLQSKYVMAGAQFEYMQFPLPGFETDFKGWGVPYFYATGMYKNMKLTVGDFYEQFGNGLIFRTYEERSLGINNSIRGARFLYQPVEGLNIKLMGGKQRRYFSLNDSYIWGGDAELAISNWMPSLNDAGAHWTVGASYVGKYEKDEVIMGPAAGDTLRKLNLPLTVGAFAVRSNFQKGNFSFFGEYAYKVNDPGFDNNYIYKPGTALMLSGSYSRKGLSALLQVKRSDNMSFRSVRMAPNGNKATISSTINHLPAFTVQQTYTLAAMYPYATQPDGEWAFQGEFSYTFPRHSLLGGKYGTKVKLNASHIRSIEKHDVVSDSISMGTDGYKSDFFKVGEEIYYQDFIVNIEKKVTADFSFNLMYMNQMFNRWVVNREKADEEGGNNIYSNIFITELKYRFNKTLTLRSELQYLATKQDKGDWMYGLLELSIAPYFMVGVSDTYNIGGEHYYSAIASFSANSHRLQVGYGRTREGYNCSGGVCRVVPASKGFQVSYNFSF